MSEDARSMKMAAVINCIVNHNARVDSAARYPGMNMQVISILDKYDHGIIQMPCPEMDFLGHPRKRGEDQSIWDVLDTDEGRLHCQKLAAKVVDNIQEYQANGYRVTAILGGDVGSPGCAVPPPGQEETGRWGVFLGAVRNELKNRSIDIPIRGLRDSELATLDEDLAWLERALA